MSHPPSSPRRQYPLLWFEQNFDTEEKIATLLRPELDSGNLTLHDYELSKDFYPRKHRFLPFLLANVCAVATIGYGRGWARPRWSTGRVFSVGTLTATFGYAWGFKNKLDGHRKFAGSLEDPAGFNRALEQVNLRLGGTTPWNYGVPTAEDDRFRVVIENKPERPLNPREFQEQSSDESPTWQDTPPSPVVPAVQRQVSSSNAAGRWDQIRTANKNGGPQSSWDALRQNHERNRIQPQASDPQSGSPFSRPEENTRTADEAQFDAMLEAERRRSDSSRT